MKTQLIEKDKVLLVWPENSLVELENGAIALTAKGKGYGTIIVPSKATPDIEPGFMFSLPGVQIEMSKIVRVIEEPVLIEFNSKS